MNCSKCKGLLVSKQYHDYDHGGSCWMATCLNCGRAFDETSILNSLHRPTDLQRKKHCKRREVGVRIDGTIPGSS